MSEAQRCANVMRRYGLKHDQNTVEAGCYEATCRELERQEFVIATQDALIAAQTQEMVNTRKAERERVAKRFDAAADAYASKHGSVCPDTGTLEFGRGNHAEVKSDYYNDLREHAEFIRAMEDV